MLLQPWACLLYTSSVIPTLAEVLALVGGRVPILIETKNTGGAGQLEVDLYEIMRHYQGKYAVQSFSPFSMGWFRKNAPEVLRGQLSATFTYGEMCIRDRYLTT